MDFVTFLIQLYGKGEEAADMLRSTGYTTPEKLCAATPKKLSEVTGLSLFSSKGMINTAKGMLQQDKKDRRGKLLKIENVGDRRAKKLRKAGLRTVEAVANTKEEKLARVLKVPQSTAGKIIKSAQEVEELVPNPGITAEETEILSAQILPQENSVEEKPKASEHVQLVRSFWKFG